MQLTLVTLGYARSFPAGLQKHYHYLEAMALDYKDVEEVNDLTQPDVNRIQRRAGHLLDQFKELVYPLDYDPEKKTTSTKRKVITIIVWCFKHTHTHHIFGG